MSAWITCKKGGREGGREGGWEGGRVGERDHAVGYLFQGSQGLPQAVSLLQVNMAITSGEQFSNLSVFIKCQDYAYTGKFLISTLHA